MNISRILAAALALALAGCMPNGPPARPLTQAEIGANASSLGPTHTTRLYQSRADCEPDDADPVWGPGQKLLGYSCFRRPNLPF